MCNALWFRPDGGLERYLEYGAAVQPVLAEAGAEILVPFLPVARSLEGSFDPDLVGFVRYPSVEAFQAMVRSDAYAGPAAIRSEAVDRSVTTVLAVA